MLHASWYTTLTHAVYCACPCLLLLQAEASQAMLERRAEELNAAELRVRELQVGGCFGVGGDLLRRVRAWCRPGSPAASLPCRQRAGQLAEPYACTALLQVRVEQQMRALEGREAELRTVEVGQQRGALSEHDLRLHPLH